MDIRSLPVFVLDIVGVVIVASSMRTRSFMFVEVRMMPHCTKRLPFASGRLLTVPLSPMETMRTASPFLSCSGFNAGALGLSFAATESLLFLSSMLLRSNIDDKNSKLSVAAKDKPKAPALKPEQLKKGDAVRIVSMGLKGTVSSLPDAKGNLFVQCGIMRTSTNIKDLVRIEEATITTPTMSKTNTGKLRMSKSFSVSPEINLLGKTVDEALAALDKYLDDAYLAHLENVRVVHGKGTGALRKAIQQHLKRIKYVKSFRQGEYGEGDAGVTIVEFKK